MICYTADLLKLFSSLKSLNPSRINPGLWKSLVSHGITRSRPTRRGCRAGRKLSTSVEQSRIPVLLNTVRGARKDQRLTRNLCNLLPVKPLVSQTYQTPKVRFALCNARSIKNKTSFLCDFIISRQLDIMVLTETWLNGDDRDCYHLADISNTLAEYNIIQKPRNGKHGGGVAVLLKKGFATSLHNHRNYQAMECLDVTVKAGNTSLRLLAIYRPPPSSKNKFTASMFFDDFNHLIEEVAAASPRSCLMCGDFNFHMDTRNSEADQFQEIILSADLRQHVDFQTHSKGHTLDLILTNSDANLVSNLRSSFDLPSDHACITSNLELPRPPRIQIHTKHRKVLNINMDLFARDLSRLHLITSTPTNLHDLVDAYNRELTDLMNSHAPIIDRSITLRPHAPWFSDGLRTLKQQKRRCERKWVTSGLEVHKQVYRESAKKYYTAIDETKRNYYNDKVSSSNQKQLFQLVNSLFKFKQAPPLPSHESSQDLAKRFNNYFSNKIKALRSDIDSLPPRDLSVGIHEPLPETILSCFDIVPSDLVRKIISSAPSKSCTLDPLPTSLLKKSIGVLLPCITSLVNWSLQTGTFPSQFKVALVTPLLKKPDLDHEVLKNYRPISNLPFLGKALERIVSMQLNQHLVTNELCSIFQSAYKVNHSTETALLRVTNDINLALDSHNDVVLVMLDLSSAFDTIDYNILIDRLQSRYGITGTALEWITSYLTNRSQSTVINHCQSDPSLLEYGVPQGSVLGPLLFSLYVAPIEDIICAHGLQPMLYADDTQVYLVAQRSNQSQLIDKLEHCIQDVTNWMFNNKLVCNGTKTDVVHFSSRHLQQHPIKLVEIDGTKIKTTTEVRDLGVMLDNNLTMASQVNSVCKSASFALRRIGTVRKFLDQTNSEKLIHAFVTSKLDYCNSLLYGLPDKQISKLQRIQNCAARILTKTKKTDHITPVLRNLHWLPIHKRIIYKILLLTFKTVSGSAPSYLCDLLSLHQPTRVLRSSKDHLRLSIKPCNTNSYGARAFSVCAPKLWNDIPLEVRSAPSKDVFKKKLKTFLFD